MQNPQTVTACFSLSSTTRTSIYPTGEGLKVQMYGVQGPPFGQATPHASLEMTIADDTAKQLFGANVRLGQQYLVTFSPVPEHKSEEDEHTEEV